MKNLIKIKLNIIWFLLELYTLSILFYPFYKFFITAKHYVIINSIILFLLLSSYLNNLIGIIFSSSNMNILFSNQSNVVSTVDFSIYLTMSPLGFFFSFLVISIGLATNIYTLNYFKSEAAELKFLWILNTFIASMITLVLGNNSFTLFIGWELIGLTSYYLINFWQERRGTLKSSYKAFSFNLVSDIFFLASILCFKLVSNTTDLDAFFIYVNSLPTEGYSNILLTTGFVCLISSCSIKSVQVIGHLWLPDSMEAPVPASSLIHSATLVSAGIYLICKFKFLILFLHASEILATIGAFTAAYGGVVAASQTDVKKLLAYSTMSHCGFLWFLASYSSAYLTILYLFLHGFFKASTFFCSGSFIRVYGTQDSRWMGSSHIFMRLETFLFLFCGANLAGLPFSIGYYYKLFFIQFLIMHPINNWNIGFLTIGLLSGLVYFYRLVFYVTFDYYKNITSLPQNSLNIVKYSFVEEYRQNSINHFIAVFVVAIISIFSCYFFYYCMTTSLFNFDFWVYNEGITTTTLQVSSLYSTYLLLFYSFYVFTIFIIFLLVWRRNIFYIESLFILGFLIVGCLLLICEVTLWLMLMP